MLVRHEGSSLPGAVSHGGGFDGSASRPSWIADQANRTELQTGGYADGIFMNAQSRRTSGAQVVRAVCAGSPVYDMIWFLVTTPTTFSSFLPGRRDVSVFFVLSHTFCDTLRCEQTYPRLR